VLTQEQGERADAILQVGFDSRTTWNAYGFFQDTVSITGNRQENARAGLGGSYRVSERLRVDAEVSDGDLGTGARLGTNYLHSDRTSLYLNYALENERTDNGLRSGRGSEGNLVAGVKSRIADSTSVFLEERYQHGTTMTGLTPRRPTAWLAPCRSVSASTDCSSRRASSTEMMTRSKQT
jgi:hypothetical protein